MIDKIIERLEYQLEIIKNIPEKCDDEGYGDGEALFADGVEQGKYESTFNAIRIVKQVAAEGDWIKCSDRLPENDREVLVYLENDLGEKTMAVSARRSFIISSKKIKGWFTTVEPYGENALNEDYVIAWQPLPEPYKESEEEIQR